MTSREMRGAQQPDGPAESEPIKDYSQERWKQLQAEGSPAYAFLEAKKIGVPAEEINRFTAELFARETAKGDFSFIYRFRKNLGIGTDAEIRATGEQAYASLMASGEFGSAMGIAEDVYGRESDEWQQANTASEKDREKIDEAQKETEEDEDLTVTIPRHATFKDLFEAIDAIEQEPGDLHFERELDDHFDPAIRDAILDLRDDQTNRASMIKILDFFEGYGFSEEDVTTFLPIEFE